MNGHPSVRATLHGVVAEAAGGQPNRMRAVPLRPTERAVSKAPQRLSRCGDNYGANSLTPAGVAAGASTATRKPLSLGFQRRVPGSEKPHEAGGSPAAVGAVATSGHTPGTRRESSGE